MLAKVHPQELLEVPAPPSFTITFNPSPSQPVTNTNQFFLTDGNGTNFLNLVVIDTDLQEISITLDERLTFHNDPTGDKAIVWTVPPPGDLPILTLSGSTLSFAVPQPTQALHPWVFRIIVDTPDIKGILSQSIFLIKPVGPTSGVLFLHYDATNGTFVLSDSQSSSAPEDGIPLDGHESVLVSVQPNVNIQAAGRQFSVHLEHGDLLAPISSIHFADTPVVWSSTDAPDWISASGGGSDDLALTIQPPQGQSAMGRSTGLRFALEITTADGQTTTVLSPDPILINSTIGDGT